MKFPTLCVKLSKLEFYTIILSFRSNKYQVTTYYIISRQFFFISLIFYYYTCLGLIVQNAKSFIKLNSSNEKFEKKLWWVFMNCAREKGRESERETISNQIWFSNFVWISIFIYENIFIFLCVCGAFAINIVSMNPNKYRIPCHIILDIRENGSIKCQYRILFFILNFIEKVFFIFIHHHHLHQVTTNFLPVVQSPCLESFIYFFFAFVSKFDGKVSSFHLYARIVTQKLSNNNNDPFQIFSLLPKRTN